MPRRTRRTFTPEFQAQVVLELLRGEQSPAELCRQHQLGPNLLSLWKQTFLERLHVVFQADEQRSQEDRRLAELEQRLGRQALELEILKSLAAADWPDGRQWPGILPSDPATSIADAVSRADQPIGQQKIKAGPGLEGLDRLRPKEKELLEELPSRVLQMWSWSSPR